MEPLTQIKERVILHSDVNNFFASVECATRPDLLNKPVAVTGNPKKRNGIILAKNEIAKKQGVKTGQVIIEAKALCPDLVCLPPHYDLYEEISLALQELYLSYTNFVEPLGLDECWLDITGCENYLHKSPTMVADEIRSLVKKNFGFTVSVGVSFSKLFAKLGSDLRKPDFTTEISYNNYKTITYNLPLNSVVGIGRRLEKKFTSIGVKTIGDFVELEDEFLSHLMGINGLNLKADLLGQRDVPVQDYYSLPPPKSIGNGTTTITDITKEKDLQNVIYFLAQKVSSRLIRHNLVASGISLTIKDNNLKRTHKSMKIAPTNSVKTLAEHGTKIAKEIYSFSRPIRAVRLKTFALSSSNFHQISMFERQKNDYSKTIDEINQKYGKIYLASDLKPYINTKSHPQE